MADRELKVVIKAKDEASGVLRSLGNVASSVLKVGLAAAAAGAAALTVALGSCVKEAMAAEEVQAGLAAVLKSTGGIAGVTAEAANDLATAISQVTKFDDEAVVSAESLMLTFTNIGEDVFPTAIIAATDMATVLGTDLESTVRQLGRALNDPIKGLTALTRMGVQFSDEQEEVIKAMVETGDVAGAQAIILEQLAVKFGGAAVAAGQTAAGQFAIFRTALGNVKETIGTALLPMLTTLAGKLTEALANPAVQAGIAAIVTWLSDMAVVLGDIGTALLTGDIAGGLAIAFGPETAAAIIDMASALGAFISDQLVPFIQQHGPALVDAFLVLGAVLLGTQVAGAIATVIAAFSTAAAIFSAAAASGGVLGVLGAALAAIGGPITLIIAAVALLAVAWVRDWGGIRTAITEWWNVTGQPIFAAISNWLSVNIPAAIAVLVQWWNVTLLPALQAAWLWITLNLLPIFQSIWDWLSINIPAAISTVVSFWETVLLPALQVVWGFITETLIPTFADVYTWLNDTLSTATTALSALWTGLLQPALQIVWTFITDHIIPLFKALVDLIVGVVDVALLVLSNLWSDVLLPALTAVWNFIKSFIEPILKTLANTVIVGLETALKRLAELWDPTIKKALEAVLEIFIKIASYIWHRLQGALGDLADIAGSAGAAIDRIAGAARGALGALQALADQIRNMPSYDSTAGAGGGGGGSGGGGGGARAAGGPVAPGSSYLVGERGPELFVPRQSGTIVPNSQIAGPTHVMNVTLNTAQSGTRVIDDLRYLQQLWSMA